MRSPMHAVEKPLLLTTFLLALVITQITTVKATPGTTVSVEPYASTAQVGETFTINVTLTNVQNLFGIEVALYWNASILQMVGADVRLGYPDGVLHEPVQKNETKEEGKYTLYGTSMYRETPSFNGSGTIVRITFNVTSVGSCKLNLGTMLANKPPPGEVASQIPHTTINGFFGPIHIFVSPKTITLGENITISGFIVPAQENVNVTILHRGEGETDWRTLATVRTSEQGNYQYTWQPQEKGKYEIRATAILEGTEEISSSVFVTVEPPKQTTLPYVIIIIIIVIIVAIATTVVYRKKSKSQRKTRRKS